MSFKDTVRARRDEDAQILGSLESAAFLDSVDESGSYFENDHFENEAFSVVDEEDRYSDGYSSREDHYECLVSPSSVLESHEENRREIANDTVSGEKKTLRQIGNLSELDAMNKLENKDSLYSKESLSLKPMLFQAES